MRGIINDFYCTACGIKGIPIYRNKDSMRETGHLKKLYCLNCQKEQNFAEVRPMGKYTVEEFKIEFNFGNFENGERKIPYKQFIRQIKFEKGDSVCQF